MDELQKSMLEKIADIHEVPEGAYNIRSNGGLAGGIQQRILIL